jgi:hypothetical protein
MTRVVNVDLLIKSCKISKAVVEKDKQINRSHH